jgi:hypothetical protein
MISTKQLRSRMRGNSHVWFWSRVWVAIPRLRQQASSAILNTLLRILNERVFENGDGTLTRVPLKLFVGASNEWPDDHDGGRELAALMDRFRVIRSAGK